MILKDQLQDLIAQNLSIVKIANILNKSRKYVSYWLKKYNLKTNTVKKRDLSGFKTCIYCKEYKSVDDFYLKMKKGYYQSSCKKCSNIKRTELRNRNKINKGKFYHTKETKDKLSKARIDFLTKNPDKHNWKSHNKFKSVPCEHLKEYLRDNNISFLEEFSVSNERHFSVDIAFPNKMIALEVNGRQHYDENNKLKPYYQERHNYIKSLGWTVIELYYAKVFQKKFKDDLLNSLLSQGITQEQIDLFEYVYTRIKKIKEKIPKNPKIKHSLEDVISIVKELGFDKAGVKIGCSGTSVRRFLKKHNIEPNQYSYYNYRKSSRATEISTLTKSLEGTYACVTS